MALPTKTQLGDAIEVSSNIKDPNLQGFQTIEGVIGAESYSGGFCVVYPLENQSGKKYAFRVWHTEIEGIKDRLRQISSYLAQHPNPYFVEFEYVDNALEVMDDDSNVQLVDAVRMEWVSGKNLVQYIDSVVTDSTFSNDEKKQKIRELAQAFLDMVKSLHAIHVSHGDLQHGNIMVMDNGSLRLVDYDSVFVPTFSNEEQITSGLAAYQHPYRRNPGVIATEHDDYFSEYIIYASLLAFAANLNLWEALDKRDEYSLLLMDSDLQDINNSSKFAELRQINDSTLQDVLKGIKNALSKPDTSDCQPLESLLINPYDNQPGVVTLSDNDLLNLIGEVQKKRTYNAAKIKVVYDEAAAQQRYAQN